MNTSFDNCLHASKKGSTLFTAILFLVLTLTLSSSAHSQTPYHAGGSQNIVTLFGTSTLHDWTMTSKSFSCAASLDVSQTNELTGMQSLTFTLPVRNLKSDHDGLNDNAYESLKADDHKDIVFRLASAKVTANGNKSQVTASGNLTIAGVTRPITMIASAQVNSDGTVTYTGTVPIKMSDFKVERPSFFLGTMKTGDDLKLTFTLVLIK